MVSTAVKEEIAQLGESEMRKPFAPFSKHTVEFLN